MRNKKMALLCGVALAVASLTIGCGGTGSSSGSSGSTQVATEAGSTSGTTTEATPEPIDDGSVIEEDTESAPEADTDAAETEAAQDETMDNPVAEVGEGSTNSFKDDAGNWINVTMNASGQWVDESGMVYTFGDDGVTDANGNFYPY